MHVFWGLFLPPTYTETAESPQHSFCATWLWYPDHSWLDGACVPDPSCARTPFPGFLASPLAALLSGNNWNVRACSAMLLSCSFILRESPSLAWEKKWSTITARGRDKKVRGLSYPAASSRLLRLSASLSRILITDCPLCLYRLPPVSPW